MKNDERTSIKAFSNLTALVTEFIIIISVRVFLDFKHGLSMVLSDVEV